MLAESAGKTTSLIQSTLNGSYIMDPGDRIKETPALLSLFKKEKEKGTEI